MNYSRQRLAANTHGGHPLTYLDSPAHINKWEINITKLERFGRIAVGLIGVMVGILLFAGSHSLIVGGLELLLILAGLDLIVTGATGHCPLYKKLGYTPKSLKGEGHEPRTHASGHDASCH